MYSKHIYRHLSILVCLLLSTASVFGQVDSTSALPVAPTDSAALSDTAEYVPRADEDPTFLESQIKYDARDSIPMDSKTEKTLLYGDAHVYYEDIELSAGFIEIDWKTNILYARGIKDSLGNIVEQPVFVDQGKSFDAEEMYYNIQTQKGRIIGVTTQEGDGFLRGEQVKRVNDDIIYVKDGYFTTDNRTPPDYYIQANRIKLIANDKIVTGPAYMVIADVPTPLVLPFGFFPSQTKRTSGIVIPTYGENANRGFFLRNGGYYWAVNDYLDLRLTGDIYSRGGWATYLQSKYNKRYKYNGQLDLSYNVIKIGDPELPNYSESRDFNIQWNHNQDPKARPNSRFSANVNAGSGSYFQNNSTNPNDFLRNQLNSTVNWTYSNPSQPFSISANLGHNQNVAERTLDLTLPDIAVNVQRFYPFESSKAGTKKWYEKIGVQYSMNFKNQVSSFDSLFLTRAFFDDFRSGIQHRIPIRTSLKVLKYFSMSPELSYTERWQFSSIRRNYAPSLDQVVTDTVNGFVTNRDFNFRTNLTTKLYGFYNFKKGKVKAIRHVLTPSFAFNYRPDFSDPFWGYYGTVQVDSAGNQDIYGYYSNGIFGGPPRGRQGTLSLDLINNIDMKLRTQSDTGVGEKKVMILESFQFNTSYNLAAETFKLNPLTFNGRTRILDNKVTIRFDGAYDFYNIDSVGQRIDEFMWENTNRIARLTRATLALSFNINADTFKKKAEEENGEGENSTPKPKKLTDRSHNYINYPFYDYVDFDMPWTLAADINFRYSQNGLTENVTQSIGFRGDVRLTEMWKIGFTSGYDLENGELTYTTLDLFRDLNSWEMRLSWVPFGFQKSYSFFIGISASMLQDVKIQRRRGLGDFNQF